ncbi:MAG: RES domain-containing protein [Pseudonocardiaceae bacterium]
MPPGEPLPALTATPTQQVIPPGTVLWRIHSRQTRADEFEFSAAVRGVGTDGRFDAPDGAYPSMYVSFHRTTAVAEQLLRGQEFTSAGTRTLPVEKLAGMVASQVETTTGLTLLRLVTEPDFLALHQSDEWLVIAGEQDYPLIRRWAAWLHDQVETTHGIVWQSTEDMPRQTAVLFGDRCSVRAVPDASVELDDDTGARWLAETLRHYRIQVSRPDPADRPLVFLNYRSSDDTAAVELLDRELIARLGERAVFRDHRSLRPGTYFPAQLIEKAQRCRVLLVLIGQHWEKIQGHRWLDDDKDWVRREIAAALKAQVRVMPVLVGARGMLREEDLPEDIRALASLQVLALKHRYTDRDVVALIDELFDAVPLLADAQID